MIKIKVSKDMLDKDGLLSFAIFLKNIGMVESTNEGKRMIENGAVTVMFPKLTLGENITINLGDK